jgi:ABC-2 type transport system ATP-binding protein
VAADTATFYRLTDAMEAHDLDLASVETVQPDLAEAFVEMTGGEVGPTGGDGAVAGGDGAAAGGNDAAATSDGPPASGPPASDGGERR